MTTVVVNDIDGDGRTDFASLTDEALHKLFVSEWLNAFELNDDYYSYCEARRDGDEAECAALEVKFPRIAELYDDWGDIHIDGFNKTAWLEEHWHMFYAPDLALTDGKASDQSKRVLLSMPRGLPRDQLIKQFHRFLDGHPDLLGDGPKYKISTKRGQTKIMVYKHILRASIAFDLIKASSDKMFKYTYAEVVQLVLTLSELNHLGFNWFPTREQKALLQQGKLPSDAVEGYTRVLKEQVKSYQAMIDGTVKGIFPAK